MIGLLLVLRGEVILSGIIMGNGSEKLKALLPEAEVIGTSSEDSEAHYLEKLFDL